MSRPRWSASNPAWLRHSAHREGKASFQYVSFSKLQQQPEDHEVRMFHERNNLLAFSLLRREIAEFGLIRLSLVAAILFIFIGVAPRSFIVEKTGTIRRTSRVIQFRKRSYTVA